MSPPRVIVGIGEAALIEGDGDPRPGGLACDVALAAVSLGHRGVVVSRVGQDARGASLSRALADAGADVRHLQADPDMPTARFRYRPDGRPAPRNPDGAAFDQLQWDFDLEDLAREADVACFGPFAWRSGQARSETMRFLHAATAGMRVVDLANRPDAPDGETDLLRTHAAAACGLAEVAVADDAAVRVLLHDRSASAGADGLEAVRRRFALAAMIGVSPGDQWSLATAQGHASSTSPLDPGGIERMRRILEIVLALGAGRPGNEALRAACTRSSSAAAADR